MCVLAAVPGKGVSRDAIVNLRGRINFKSGQIFAIMDETELPTKEVRRRRQCKNGSFSDPEQGVPPSAKHL
ncbi:MAG: hypothetical protein ACJAYR_002325 [Sneathiella sp.]|jgi:hypothetical protein